MSIDRAKSNAYMTLHQHYSSLVIMHQRQLQGMVYEKYLNFKLEFFKLSRINNTSSLDPINCCFLEKTRPRAQHIIVHEFFVDVYLSRLSRRYHKFTNSPANHLRFLQRVNETTTHKKPLPVLSFPKRLKYSSFFMPIISSINHL